MMLLLCRSIQRSSPTTIQSQSIHFDGIEVGQFVQKGQDSPFVIQDGLLQ